MPVLALALVLAQFPAAIAQAQITPGSVQDSLGTGKAQIPVTPPKVLLPVQPPPSQHDPRARRFRVNAFNMSGNTVYRERLLKTLLERYVDMELNLHDLSRAADTITTYYHDHGYTLARAFIPPQKVENGVVNIHIVEGRIGRVSFSGNRRYSTAFLTARTGLLAPGSLVTTDRLENNMLLLNDLPGLSAKAVLTPGADIGTTDTEIQVEERLFSGSMGINNHGRKETGKNRVEASFSINSPFGWGDQLALSASSTQHELVRYWRAGYSVPVNSIGTRLSVGSSKAAYDVSGAMATLGLSGEVTNTELALSHPLVRTRDDSRTFNLTLRRTRLVQNALGVELSDERLSVMTAALQFVRIHPDASLTNGMLGLSTNFKSGNTAAKQDAVRARMELDINHTAPLYQRWDLYLRGNFMYSGEMLPDTEKFSLGGPGSVRAFRPSEVRGDSGSLVTMELRRPFSIGNKIGSFRVNLDAGEVIYKMPGHRDSHTHLRSVGIGASLYPAKGMVASIDLARPVGPVPASADGENHRLWVNVSAGF